MVTQQIHESVSKRLSRIVVSGHRGRLVKKVEVSSAEKGTSGLGTAYQRAVEMVLGFGHDWIYELLCLEKMFR